MQFSFYLKLLLACQDNHDLIGGVREVFPSLAWWISPQVATETTRCPGGGVLVAVGRRLCSLIRFDILANQLVFLRQLLHQRYNAVQFIDNANRCIVLPECVHERAIVPERSILAALEP